MDQDRLLREVEALRERLSRLSEASLHLNESLEIDRVLQEAVESARTLANVRYGMIATLDDRGPEELLHRRNDGRRAPSVGGDAGGIRFLECLKAPRAGPHPRLQQPLRGVGSARVSSAVVHQPAR